MLQATRVPDFLVAAHEWRRLFSEAWGTFLLVVVASGAGIAGVISNSAVTLGMKVVAPGIMVMAIIYFSFLGEISGRFDGVFRRIILSASGRGSSASKHQSKLFFV